MRAKEENCACIVYAHRISGTSVFAWNSLFVLIFIVVGKEGEQRFGGRGGGKVLEGKEIESWMNWERVRGEGGD